MQNGITINGVEYEAVATSDPRRKCQKCALKLQCFQVGQVCHLFGTVLYYFVRLKDRPAITKEEAAKRITEYAMNNLDRLTHGDTKEVLAEINKLL